MNCPFVSGPHHFFVAGLYFKRNKPMKEWKIGNFQKQPFADVLSNIFFVKNFQNSKKNPCAVASFLMPFQVLGQHLCLKKWLWRTCFPVNFSNFLRAPPGNCLQTFFVLFCVYFSNIYLANFMKFSYKLPLSNCPAGTYVFKANDRNTEKGCEIYSKLVIKTPELCQWCQSRLCIVNSKHISNLFLVFLLLTLNR